MGSTLMTASVHGRKAVAVPLSQIAHDGTARLLTGYLRAGPSTQVARSNGRSLMSRSRLPVTRVSSSSASESLPSAAAVNSLSAKW